MSISIMGIRAGNDCWLYAPPGTGVGTIDACCPATLSVVLEDLAKPPVPTMQCCQMHGVRVCKARSRRS
eukprot:s827_g1.t1